MNRMEPISVAVAVLLLAGCATLAPEATKATSVEDINGIWQTVGTEDFLQFKEDGTYVFAHGGPEHLEDMQPHHAGEFWFEGSQLFIKRTASDNNVCINLTGIYEVQPLPSGNLTFIDVEEECERRARHHFRGFEFEPLP